MSRFGALVTVSDVEQAVIKTIEYWVDTYLAGVEAAHGVAAGFTARPRSYNATFDDQNWPEGQLPSIAVVCAGTTGDPDYSGDGTIAAWFDVNIDATVADETEALTRTGAARYQTAIAALLVAKRQLRGGTGSPFATDLRLTGYKLVLPDANNRTLVVGTTSVRVLVDSILDFRAGPAVLPSPPESPPPDAPTITTVEVNVIGEH